MATQTGSIDLAAVSAAGGIANNALTSANGKNKIYHQAVQPTGGTYVTGDTWFDTDDGYKMYTYNGSSWVAEQFGEDAIANLAITNAKIADGTIQNAKISTLDAGKITTGTLNAARIGAGSLTIGMIDQTDAPTVSALLNSSIEIGGRNLLLDTATQRVSPASADGSAYALPSPTLSDYGYSIITSTDDYYTYSFDYSVTGNSATEAHVYIQFKGAYVSTAGDTYAKNVYDEPTGHFSCTFAPTSTQVSRVDKTCNIRLRLATDGAILTVWNMKLEKGNKETTWTPAPEDTDANIAQVQTNLDNLEVGGRNILLNTSGETQFTTTTIVWDVSPWKEYISADDDLTISFMAKGSVAMWNDFYWRSDSTSYVGTEYFYPSFQLTTEWQSFTATAKASAGIIDALYLRQRQNSTEHGDATNVGTVYVKNLKLEVGNKATSWSVAPEDIEAEIAAKKSIHTLSTGYSYTYANALARAEEGYTNNWTVSSTAGVKVGDTVRLKVTVADMNDTPVYIVGEVLSVNSSTVLNMKSHGLDTTVISGGNILTNSIGANQIAANSLTIGVINLTDTSTASAISNSSIEIGGKNLMLNTLYPDVNNRPKIIGSTVTCTGRGTASTATHGIRFTVTQSQYQYIYIGITSSSGTNASMQGLTAGETYTLSADYSCKLLSNDTSSATEAYLPCMLFDDTSGSWAVDQYETMTNITQADKGQTLSGHFSFTFTLPTNITKLGFIIRASITDNAKYATGDFIELRNIMLEKSNKASNWSPAQEDTDAAISDAAKVATNYLNFTSGTGLDVGYSGTNAKTRITGSGVSIYANDTTNYATVDSNGMKVYKGINGSATQVAQFGSTVLLGDQTSDSKIILDPTGDTTSIRIPLIYNNVVYGYFLLNKNGLVMHADNTSVSDGFNLQVGSDLSGNVETSDEVIGQGGVSAPFIQARGNSSSVSIGANWTKVPIVAGSLYPGEFGNWEYWFDISDGGVKVLYGGLYRVSASVYYSAQSSASRLGVGILKGTAFLSASEKCCSLNYIGEASGVSIVTTGPKLIVIDDNDIIYLAGRTVSGSATAHSSTTHTFLLLEKVGSVSDY